MDDFDPANYRPRENDDDMRRFYNLVWRISALLREGNAETQQLEGLVTLIRGSDAFGRAARHQIPELRAAEANEPFPDMNEQMIRFLAGILERDPLAPVTPPIINPVVDMVMKTSRDMLVNQMCALLGPLENYSGKDKLVATDIVNKLMWLTAGFFVTQSAGHFKPVSPPVFQPLPDFSIANPTNASPTGTPSQASSLDRSRSTKPLIPAAKPSRAFPGFPTYSKADGSGLQIDDASKRGLALFSTTGLYNGGNTCYQTASFFALVHTPRFIEKVESSDQCLPLAKDLVLALAIRFQLLESGTGITVPIMKSNKKICIDSLEALWNKLSTWVLESTTPDPDPNVNIRNARSKLLRAESLIQQDAAEWLMFLQNYVFPEMREIFGTVVVTHNYFCTACQSDTPCGHSDHRDRIQLAVPGSHPTKLEELLNREFESVNLSDYECESCLESGQVMDEPMIMSNPPDNVMIQLLRFQGEGENKQKYTGRVTFPKGPFPVKVVGGTVEYLVNAVICHRSRFMTTGHYYCLTRRGTEGPSTWTCWDDGNYHRATPEELHTEDAVIFLLRRCDKTADGSVGLSPVRKDASVASATNLDKSGDKDAVPTISGKGPVPVETATESKVSDMGPVFERKIGSGMPFGPASPPPSGPTTEIGEDPTSLPEFPELGNCVMERTMFRGQVLWKRTSYDGKRVSSKGVELTQELFNSLANPTEECRTDQANDEVGSEGQEREATTDKFAKAPGVAREKVCGSVEESQEHLTVATPRLGAAGASLDDNHAATPTPAPFGPTTPASLLLSSMAHAQIASRYMVPTTSPALSLTCAAEHTGSRIPEIEASDDIMPDAESTHLPDSDLLLDLAANGNLRSQVEVPVSLASDFRSGPVADMFTCSHHPQSDSTSSQHAEKEIYASLTDSANDIADSDPETAPK